MNQQDFSEQKQTVIESDVWVGSPVIFTPGNHINKGTIIAARAVVINSFPKYSIIGGNPAKLIKLHH